jgi:hypothetical protein
VANKKNSNRKYVTGTGEVLYTDDAGIAYLQRMVDHCKGLNEQIDRLKDQLTKKQS